jgi:hypothetical protein
VEKNRIQKIDEKNNELLFQFLGGESPASVTDVAVKKELTSSLVGQSAKWQDRRMTDENFCESPNS